MRVLKNGVIVPHGPRNTNTARHAPSYGTAQTQCVGLFDAFEKSKSNVVNDPETYQRNIMKMMSILDGAPG